jgi:Tol biopolymer transport system component
MLTGHMPFRGEHEAAMIYSIVNEEPTPIQKHLPEVSSELVHVLNRALEKDPSDRYQNVAEMVIDLRRLKKQTSKIYRSTAAEAGSTERLAAEPRLSPPRKKVAWIGACVLVLVVIVAALVILTQRAPKFNPNAALRALAAPLHPDKNPSLSSDGNWIAFAAHDEKGFADIYMMHVSGGELRRVTKDSAQSIGSCAISPDGSLIVYSRRFKGERHREIAVVSSNGGVSRRIAEVGTRPIWRPDGKRIGYYRGFGAQSESGRPEFWTMNPDGSDKRLELRDSTSVLTTSTNVAVSWSPDGKSIAWSRLFPNRSVELITRELETGKEHQLTFDGKSVPDILWTPQNMIIFSSSRGGPTNLWVISPEGGEPIQVTRGPGTDECGSISEDGRRFIYSQAQGVSQLWTINPDGSDLKQITIADERILAATFSPDRKSIAMVVGDPDYLKDECHLFAMDRATGSRQQLTSGSEYIFWPSWSPDGRWIAFGRRSTQEPVDSSKIYLLEAMNPENRRMIGNGFNVRWLNATEFLIRKQTQYWRSSITGSDPKPFYEDSTYTIPCNTPTGNYFVIDDRRYDRRGLWILTEERRRKLQQPTKLISGTPGYSVSYDGKFVDFGREQDEWWRMSLPSGRQTFVKKLPRNLTGADRSYDGKEYLLTMSQDRRSIMLMEDLFK